MVDVASAGTDTVGNTSYNPINSLRLKIIADMTTIGFTDAYATIKTDVACAGTAPTYPAACLAADAKYT